MKHEFKAYETTAIDWEGRPWFVYLEKRQARCNCRPKYGVRAFRDHADAQREPNRWFYSEAEALEWAEHILAKHYDGHLGEEYPCAGHITNLPSWRKSNR